MKVRSLVASLVVLGMLPASCANSSAVPGGDDAGGTRIGYPTGASDLVLRMTYEGGFVPVDHYLTALPAFSLFGDGTTVAPGAQTAIYPGPALPALVAIPIAENGVQALLRESIDAGLGHDASYTDLGSVGIADAATTVFTLTVDGETHVTEAYALGELGPKPEGMPQAEFDARTKLLDLQSSLRDLEGTLPEGSVGDDGPFIPDGLRLLVSDYRPDEALGQEPVDWPLTTPLPDFGGSATMGGYRCGTVSGADLDVVLPLAREANQLTPWRSEGTRYAIVFRPLLPDDSGC